jgi:hypothetical protein
LPPNIYFRPSQIRRPRHDQPEQRNLGFFAFLMLFMLAELVEANRKASTAMMLIIDGSF